jgi:hypothetical protein
MDRASELSREPDVAFGLIDCSWPAAAAIRGYGHQSLQNVEPEQLVLRAVAAFLNVSSNLSYSYIFLGNIQGAGTDPALLVLCCSWCR